MAPHPTATPLEPETEYKHQKVAPPPYTKNGSISSCLHKKTVPLQVLDTAGSSTEVVAGARAAPNRPLMYDPDNLNPNRSNQVTSNY